MSTKKKLATPPSVEGALAHLNRLSTEKTRDGMSRYGIPSDNAYGVKMADIIGYAKQIGRNHELALALWGTANYEARTLAAHVADPKQLTLSQMNAWARDFDSWAICDTLSFHLFDRSPHAWKKVHHWATERREFVRRASFAMLAGLTIHDKPATDQNFVECLPLIEAAADDDRNFVKKAVNWALRSIGKRSSRLNEAAIATARTLADREESSARWIGKDALRELESAAVQGRLAKKRDKKRAK